MKNYKNQGLKLINYIVIVLSIYYSAIYRLMVQKLYASSAFYNLGITDQWRDLQ